MHLYSTAYHRFNRYTVQPDQIQISLATAAAAGGYLGGYRVVAVETREAGTGLGRSEHTTYNKTLTEYSKSEEHSNRN